MIYLKKVKAHRIKEPKNAAINPMGKRLELQNFLLKVYKESKEKTTVNEKTTQPLFKFQGPCESWN